MEVLCLSYRLDYLNKTYSSFIIKFSSSKEIWLINCSQGCQHLLIDHKIKMHQISKIFITDLYYDNISGLLGVLSSLNLVKRIKPLYLYGPNGLQHYLDLGKKYSRTNFSYLLYVHLININNKCIINYMNYKLYIISCNKYYKFYIITVELPGKFMLTKANHLNLLPGPLYGKLKKCYIFILPDGLVIKGISFIFYLDRGIKLYLLHDKYHDRLSIENSINAVIMTT